MKSLFGKARSVEAQIDQFLDDISEAGLICKAGIKDYLEDNTHQFEKRIQDINKLEADADKVRREIRYYLYKKMLIPESRGDVLGLLETSDNVIDTCKSLLSHLDIERPAIPDFLNDSFLKLTEASLNALSSLVKANRAFFYNNDIIHEYIHKVHFYEHEADRIEEELKKSIFRSEKIQGTAEKIILRDLVTHISSLADESEDVSERLSVYSIKRSI